MEFCRKIASRRPVRTPAMGLSRTMAALFAVAFLTLQSVGQSWAQSSDAISTEAGDRNATRESLGGGRLSDPPLTDPALSQTPAEARPAPPAVEASPKPALPDTAVAAPTAPAPTPPAKETSTASPPAENPPAAPAVVTIPAAVPAPSPPPLEKAVVPAASATGSRSGLRLAVQPGAHLAAQQKAIHAPFVALTGAAITVVPWPAGGNPLKDESGAKLAWDLAEVDAEVARQACDAGVIERIDTAVLAKSLDSAPPERDYIAGGLTPCGVASVSWSSLIAFDQRAWPAPSQGQAARTSKRAKAAPAASARTPDKLADVFDVAAFPGKRAFRRGPRYILEMSLIADGVAPEEVYRVLAGEDGTYRAFARLEALRGQINWVETPAAASRQLADRSAVMAMVYSGRAFQSVAVDGKGYGLIWEGQLYHLSAWVVAKSAPRESARAFLGVASDPTHLAAQAALFPYGPPRASAVAKVGRHPVLKTDMAPYLPTAPVNLRSALQFDARFWEIHERRLSETFEAWLKAPLAAPTRATVQPPVQPTGQPPAATQSEAQTPNASILPAANAPPAAPSNSGVGKTE